MTVWSIIVTAKLTAVNNCGWNFVIDVQKSRRSPGNVATRVSLLQPCLVNDVQTSRRRHWSKQSRKITSEKLKIIV